MKEFMLCRQAHICLRANGGCLCVTQNLLNPKLPASYRYANLLHTLIGAQ